MRANGCGSNMYAIQGQKEGFRDGMEGVDGGSNGKGSGRDTDGGDSFKWGVEGRRAEEEK